MSFLKQVEQLAHEHGVLLRQHGKLQRRWTELEHRRQAELAQLQALVMRLRAQLLIQDSRLLWEREDRATLPAEAAMAPAQPTDHAEDMPLHWLTRGLLAVDLVICQTGCISHGGHWREDEHCRRLGRTCLQVTHPEALPLGAPVQASAQLVPSDSATHAAPLMSSITPLPPKNRTVGEQTPSVNTISQAQP